MQFMDAIIAKLDKLDRNELKRRLPMLDYNSKTPKQELVRRVGLKIKENPVLAEEIYAANINLLAVHPCDLEILLGLTQGTRRKLVDHGFFKVVHSEKCTYMGRQVDVKYYDLYQVIALINDPAPLQEQLDLFNKKTVQKRHEAIKKARNVRAKNEVVRNTFKDEMIQTVTEWNTIGSQQSAILELAFWTMWISRWAKHFQEKAYSGRSNALENRIEKKKMCYEFKNQAIALMIKSPYATCSFYRPENADRLGEVTLCNYHQDMWRTERMYDSKLGFGQFLDSYKKDIMTCGECQSTVIKDYYSLFVLDIKVPEIPDVSFNFHTPYGIGEPFFPIANTLNQITYAKEQGGMFRFGRSLTEQEEIIFTEKYTLKQFKKAYEKCMTFIENKQQHEAV